VVSNDSRLDNFFRNAAPLTKVLRAVMTIIWTIRLWPGTIRARADIVVSASRAELQITCTCAGGPIAAYVGRGTATGKSIARCRSVWKVTLGSVRYREEQYPGKSR
jgi:hypothetical protein